MSTELLNTDVSGNEALSVGERFTSFFKELSVGFDAFNAKNFNKSIHTVKGGEVWKDLANQNVYFSAAIKHIPSPVFFNPSVWSFKDFVEFVLHAVPIIKMVDSQADNVYRGIKKAAATGQVPFSIRNVNDLVLISKSRETFQNFMKDTGAYTRSLNELYPNFGSATDILNNFNTVVQTLNARDVEVVSKRMDNVIYVTNLLKAKIEESEVILNPKETESLNMAIGELVDNANFAGIMLAQLSELTRVLQLQVTEAKKLA